MDEDDECNAFRQVLEKECPRAKFRGEDIEKLVDAGYDTEFALMAATKDSLDRVLPTRPEVVDLLIKAFVQSTVSAAEPNELVKEFSQVSLQPQQLQNQIGDVMVQLLKWAEDVKEQLGDIKEQVEMVMAQVDSSSSFLPSVTEQGKGVQVTSFIVKFIVPKPLSAEEAEALWPEIVG